MTAWVVNTLCNFYEVKKTQKKLKTLEKNENRFGILRILGKKMILLNKISH